MFFHGRVSHFRDGGWGAKLGGGREGCRGGATSMGVEHVRVMSVMLSVGCLLFLCERNLVRRLFIYVLSFTHFFFSPIASAVLAVVCSAVSLVVIVNSFFLPVVRAIYMNFSKVADVRPKCAHSTDNDDDRR